MTLDLSAAAILEKNKLVSDGAWIVLLEVTLSDDTVVRICRNTEDIIWNSHTWQAFPFELDEASEESGEQTMLTVRVSNVTRALMPYVEQYGGLVGNTVKLYVVHSDALDYGPEVEEEFVVVDSTSDPQWITFSLSASSLKNVTFPNHRYVKNWCRFKFNYPPGTGLRCGYSGATPYTTCNKTLSDCRKRGNSERFGGFPGIPEGGLYVTT